ncbi:MAG: hypothetical protein KC449_30525 [Anaerolineales bacterium]|nr:hypothetical protein [Anaerolineales bacterium]
MKRVTKFSQKKSKSPMGANGRSNTIRTSDITSILDSPNPSWEPTAVLT